MRRRFVVALAVFAVGAAGAPWAAGRPVGAVSKVRHTHGCRTMRCDLRVGRAWWIKHHPRPRAVALPWSTEASWYEDAGGTACGTHEALGVASHYEGQPDWAGLPCGTNVRICLEGRCITAVVQDRGPFVAGRELDLNPGAKNALGCSGVCRVSYGIAH